MDGQPSGPSFPEASRRKVKEAIREVIDVGFLQYRRIHEHKHGVREANLKRLVLPIGVGRKTWIDLAPT